MFSCTNKDELEQLTKEKTEVWKSNQAPIITLDENTDTLTFESYGENGKLTIKMKYTGEWRSPLIETGRVTYQKTTVGSTVPVEYNLLPGRWSSVLQMNMTDFTSQIMKAEFQVSLKKSTSGSSPESPEVLHITNGKLFGHYTVIPKVIKEEVWISSKKPIIRYYPSSLGIELENAQGELILSLGSFTGVKKYTFPINLFGIYSTNKTGELSLFDFSPKGECMVEITSWDPVTKKVKGRFNLYLVNSITEEYLNYTGGEFEGVAEGN